MTRFGEKCSFVENQPLFSAGECLFNSQVILSGRVRIVDTLTGVRRIFVRYGVGRVRGTLTYLHVVLRTLQEQIPTRPLGKPSEVAEAVVFFAADESAGLAALEVTGGQPQVGDSSPRQRGTA